MGLSTKPLHSDDITEFARYAELARPTLKETNRIEDTFRYYGMKVPDSTQKLQDVAGEIAESHLKKQFDASVEDVMANPDKARAFGSET
jgi:hypothetical protein